VDPRDEIRKCLDDLRAGLAKWQGGQTASAEKTIEEACNKLLSLNITLAPTMPEANIEFAAAGDGANRAWAQIAQVADPAQDLGALGFQDRQGIGHEGSFSKHCITLRNDAPKKNGANCSVLSMSCTPALLSARWREIM
jgi:hypothetical protein